VRRGIQRGSVSLPLAGALLTWGLAVWGAEVPPQPVDGDISWVYNYAEGQRLARESGKPLFVVFRCER
jgi:hypothetical protein